MDSNLYVWDNNVKGIMLKYSNLKIRRRLIEIVAEQDFINIPVQYQALYFIPNEDDEAGCFLCIIFKKINNYIRWGSI
jgi:hypothetical protein